MDSKPTKIAWLLDLGIWTQHQQNHLEESTLDQAHARTPYTPLLGGHSRSIPQGMILDVQLLVKSLFRTTKQSPNGFFDSEASIPLKVGTIFFGGGGQKCCG